MLTKTLRCLAAAVAVAVSAGLAGEALADPPPWAPAHGWRAKHGHARGPDVVVVERPVLIAPRAERVACDRSLLAGNNRLVGQILGGSLGGLAGAQIGSGSGQLAATAGGAVLGLLLGGEIGRSLDAADAACAQYALETADDGHTVTWLDPAQDIGYAVTPTHSYRSGEAYCREYTGRAQIAGRTQRTYGTACRQPDGSWRLVD